MHFRLWARVVAGWAPGGLLSSMRSMRRVSYKRGMRKQVVCAGWLSGNNTRLTAQVPPFKVSELYYWTVILNNRRSVEELARASNEYFSFLEAVDDVSGGFILLDVHPHRKLSQDRAIEVYGWSRDRRQSVSCGHRSLPTYSKSSSIVS
jgi:hypothetical protein